MHQSTDFDTEPLASQAGSFNDPRHTDFQRLARADPRVHGEQPTIFQVTMRTVERNPLLALAAVGLLGAVTAMALTRSRKPRSRYHQIEHGIRQQTSAIEKALRDEMRRARASERFGGLSDALARNLSSIDFSRFAWLQQAGLDLYDKAKNRIGASVR